MNTLAAWADAKLADLIKEKSVGETVNAHVVPFAREPQPDFDHMQRTITGTDAPSPPIDESQRDGTD